VVLTSSVAAVANSDVSGSVFSETDWSDPSSLRAYSKSKVLAERAAWDFVNGLSGEKKLELVAINPCVVIGPLITSVSGTSIETVKKLLDSRVPGLPKLLLNLVDVRDVAKAHVLALTNKEAPGNRFIITSEAVWMQNIAQIIRNEFSSQGYNIPSLALPKWLMWIASCFDSTISLIYPMIGKEVRYDNNKMKDVLGITPIPVRDSILDSCYSLIEKGLVVRKPGFRPRNTEQ
jgi:nucleoside-diphosphate-sugar epimerase